MSTLSFEGDVIVVTGAGGGMGRCHALELAQPTVSYHLKLLREAGLLDREKRGTFAYFRIRQEAMERLHSLVEPAALARTA